MSSDVAAYFERLRNHLQLGDARSGDVMRELASHVEDRVDDLVARGVPPERAQRTAIEALGRPRTLAHLLHQAHLVTPWTDALIGASAFALLAVVAGGQLWRLPLIAALAAGAVIAIALCGLWQGRPAWFYPWAGVALSLLLIAGYIAFAVLHRAASGELTPLAFAGVAGAVLYFPIGAIVVSAAVVVAARRDWLDASVLLSPLPGMLTLIVAVHRGGGLTSGGDPLPLVSMLLFALYLCMAVGAMLMLRAPMRQMKVAILVGGAIALLGATTLIGQDDTSMMTLAGRAALLLAFLLSPALVARHA